MTHFLSDAEIQDMCEGLRAAAAQVRYLQGLGLLVQRKPNGRPLLARSECERVLGAGRYLQHTVESTTSRGPNRAALVQLIQGGQRGPKAQRP